MIHLTVGIAQFFVLLLEQMAIVFLGVAAVGVATACGAFAIWRFAAARSLSRRQKR